MKPEDKAAIELALEVIETPIHEQPFMAKQKAITALRQLLERTEPVQEPVGKVGWAANVPNTIREVHWTNGCPPVGSKLYTTPPAQPAPVQEPSLLATLKAVQGTLIAANEQGQLTDTIWFSEHETLFDFIGAEIDKAEQATPPAQPADHADELTIAYMSGVHTGKKMKREWVGLTAKDLSEIPANCYEGAIWADAKLKEKNT